MDMQQDDRPCEQVCAGLVRGKQEKPCTLRCTATGDTPGFVARINKIQTATADRRSKTGATLDTGVTDRINFAVCRAGQDLEVSLLEMETIVTHPLFVPLLSAIQQAAFGKGERHGGAAKPFLEQPWHLLAEQHGVGFLTGQAAKKVGEAAAGKTGADWDREVLGAVVYLGMSLIFHREP